MPLGNLRLATGRIHGRLMLLTGGCSEPEVGFGVVFLMRSPFLVIQKITLYNDFYARHPGLARFWQKTGSIQTTLPKAPTKVYTHGPLLHTRGFIPLEMGVISAKKEALQAISISKNLARDALTFR